MQITGEDIEKQLAIMEEEGDPWFIHDGIAYEGDFDEAQAAFEESSYNVDQTLEDYIENECIPVEEYDEHKSRWLVLTDDEADKAYDDSLDSYIDECILPEIPEAYHFYFDKEKWKDDAKIDGRGHSLAGYDGNECEQTINGTTYYLYRQR